MTKSCKTHFYISMDLLEPLSTFSVFRVNVCTIFVKFNDKHIPFYVIVNIIISKLDFYVSVLYSTTHWTCWIYKFLRHVYL